MPTVLLSQNESARTRKIHLEILELSLIFGLIIWVKFMFTAMCIEIPQLAATSFISHNYRGPVIKSSLNKSY